MEQCDLFDESLIEPLESTVSTHWTAVPVEVRQACAMRRPVNVIGSPQQLVTIEPEVQTPAAVQRYLLNINLKRGKNLVVRDKRSGRSANLQVGPGNMA